MPVQSPPQKKGHQLEKHQESALKQNDALEWRLKFQQRDSEAKDLEQKCQNLSSKVDSLIKFLEDERHQRKEAQSRVKAQEDHIRRLERDLDDNMEADAKRALAKGEMQDELAKLKKENEKLKTEKIEAVNEK